MKIQRDIEFTLKLNQTELLGLQTALYCAINCENTAGWNKEFLAGLHEVLSSGTQ